MRTILLMKTNLKQQITKAVRVYIFGCCVFALVALASISFAYYFICYYQEHNLPTILSIIPIAGVVLLWEMLKSFNIKASLPPSFKLITKEKYPALFDIISEVTDRLGLSPIRRVYISPDTAAAVFIQPTLRNILFEPRKDLVIGLAILTQFDDDEIRAMLYHELGHYVQAEMRTSMSVYTIGQFSRSFVAIKEPIDREDMWKLYTRLQLLLFTYFTITSCNKINRLYVKLSKQMEYDADDVAVKYVGKHTLQRALLHAAYIRYNYEFVQWGLYRLQEMGISVDNEYLALSYVSDYSSPSYDLLNREVIHRVERLGDFKVNQNNVSKGSVREYAMRFSSGDKCAKQICPAIQFASWLREGSHIYNQQRLLEKSVTLEIHLAYKRHDLPLVDSSYKILLDDNPIGVGNFIKGYTLTRRTSPGKHTIKVWAPNDIISTPLEFDTSCNKKYRIEMDYILYRKEGIYDVFAEKVTEI